MGILDISADQMVNAAASMEPPRIPQPKPGPSAWRSVWNTVNAPARGATVGLVAEPLASLAETIGGFGQVLGAYPEAFGYIPTGKARQQADDARAKLLREGVSMNNDIGDSLRRAGASYRPDPETSNVAEQVLYGFARGASKVVGGAVAGGPIGIGFAALEEANTQAEELQQQGVPFVPRVAAGAVQGMGLGLAGLPLVGATKPATWALYAAGGPGGFIAQQALTREILQNAGQERIAMQYDPFDMLGLGMATAIPLPFLAYGLRGQRLQRAADSLPPDLATAEGRAPAAAAPDAPAVPTGVVPVPDAALSPVARAARSYPTEAVDAALVVHLAEQRARSNPMGEGAPMRAADQHAAALARAEEQIAAGEAVRVTDVAPDPVITPAQRDANFAAWFGDSKVVDAAGRPLVVYHGTAADIPSFDAGKSRDVGFHFGGADAANYVAERERQAGRSGANAVPVFLAIRNPLRVQDTNFSPMAFARALADQVERGAVQGIDAAELRALAESFEVGRPGAAADAAAKTATYLLGKGFDGLVYSNRKEGGGDSYVAFRPEQIKSAIGNSGRFDPNSPSLTDPLDQFAQRLSTGLDDLRAELEAQGFRPLADTPPGGRPDAPAVPRAASGADITPTSTATTAPRQIIDTRGTGVRFHGTSRPIDSLSNEYAMSGDSRNIYGQGFYTTDAADISSGYMKKGKGGQPTLYTVTESPVKLFDMEAPLSPETRDMLRRTVGDADYEGADSLITKAGTLREWFDEFRQESRNFGLSRDDVQEVWDSIRYNLEDGGYRGYRHIGGDKTGKAPHEVKIFWYPEQDVSITPANLDDFRELPPPGATPGAPVTHPGTDAQTPRAATPTAEAAPPAGTGAAAAADVPGAGGGADEAGRVTPPAGDQAAAARRIAEVQAQFPDLQVFMDGMEKPMPMADFLAAVQREADAEVAGAPDLMDAATCALLFGGRPTP